MARVRRAGTSSPSACCAGLDGEHWGVAGEGQCSVVVHSQLPAELLKTRDGPTLPGEASSAGSFRSPLGYDG